MLDGFHSYCLSLKLLFMKSLSFVRVNINKSFDVWIVAKNRLVAWHSCNAFHPLNKVTVR